MKIPEYMQPENPDRILAAEVLICAGRVLELIRQAVPTMDTDEAFAITGPFISAAKRLLAEKAQS